MNQTDTIAAVSSATGSGGRAIVRLSGAESLPIAATLAKAATDAAAGWAGRAEVAVRGVRVPAWSYVFRGPGSYTGEDTVELHVPGNPLLVRWILDALMEAGARPAEAGEFTARAYINGRLDLSEAEGVAATIAASNEAELAAARQLMAGELSRRLSPVMDRLAETLALLEVGIDFTDEDVTFLSEAELRRRLREMQADLRRLVEESARFEQLSHEPRIVLIGRPNAGKSTLLNVLAGSHRAVVSPVAGTTRDALTAEVRLASGMVTMIDVAGLEAGDAADDVVAAQMRRRVLATVREADRVVLVRDLTDEHPPVQVERAADLMVGTKADLVEAVESTGAPDGLSAAGARLGPGACVVSAVTGQGLEALRKRLDELAFGTGERATLALNARHLQCIDEALAGLGRAGEQAGGAVEVAAMELREALDALGGVLGVVTPDDLLGRVFSQFCIGK